MNLNQEEIAKLKNEGFVIKKNILSIFEINKIKSLILENKEGKNNKENTYPSNYSKILLKIFKLELKKASAGKFFLTLKNKLSLDKYASEFFGEQSILKMIDGYHNKMTDNEILPWHSDQSYSGATNIKKINPPDHFFLKFFFYLTAVGPNNGCTSYIPFSHKVTYAVRSCIFNKEINYQPFWSINDLVKIIKKNDNYEKIKNKLEEDELLENFLHNANKCISDKFFSAYDFYANPGDVLIFNECGVHRGSNPVKNDRIVLRYLYSKKNY